MFDDDEGKLMIVGFIILFGGIALVIFYFNLPQSYSSISGYFGAGGAIAIIVGLIIAIPNAKKSMR
jgi:hypothetical protein